MARVRVDIAMLYAAIELTLAQRGLSWRQAARQMGLSPSTLSRLGRGHTPNVDAFVTMLQWLNIPAAAFMANTGSAPTHRSSLAVELAAVLHSRDDLHQRDAEHLLALITTTVRWFEDRRRSDSQSRPTARQSPSRTGALAD